MLALTQGGATGMDVEPETALALAHVGPDVAEQVRAAVAPVRLMLADLQRGFGDQASVQRNLAQLQIEFGHAIVGNRQGQRELQRLFEGLRNEIPHQQVSPGPSQPMLALMPAGPMSSGPPPQPDAAARVADVEAADDVEMAAAAASAAPAGPAPPTLGPEWAHAAAASPDPPDPLLPVDLNLGRVPFVAFESEAAPAEPKPRTYTEAQLKNKLKGAAIYFRARQDVETGKEIVRLRQRIERGDRSPETTARVMELFSRVRTGIKSDLKMYATEADRARAVRREEKRAEARATVQDELAAKAASKARAKGRAAPGAFPEVAEPSSKRTRREPRGDGSGPPGGNNVNFV